MKNLKLIFTTILDLCSYVSTQPKQTDSSAVDFDTAQKLATNILRNIMQFRRVLDSKGSCEASSCRACLTPHLHKVASTITRRKPITFVLPAFPGKSPNSAKVLGTLPDMAEQQALQFLNAICNKIKEIYTPGAQIILCSDGRVFSDMIGMKEDAVTAYQFELENMIEELNAANILTFTLENLYEGKDFFQLRRKLMEQYGKPLESLKERVRRGGRGSENIEDKECHRIYCGITRFLVEDSLYPGQTKSRSSIQKDCRIRAYEVIRRSNAWSKLIEKQFPQAVRLSIHPQSCGTQKLGIQLGGTEKWMTPWHGVAVDTGKGFILMKRWEAEELGAQLELDAKGRSSHYKLDCKVNAAVEGIRI